MCVCVWGGCVNKAGNLFALFHSKFVIVFHSLMISDTIYYID